MNPESRIKLIRSLEEIREQESNTHKFTKIFNWAGGGLFIVIMASIGSTNIVKENPSLILYIILPAVLQIFWYLIHKKMNENYKILASTVLELGSIAQESPDIIVPKIVPVKQTISKKLTPKRKRK